jgi:type IX secretion system PorP/SprF family membrane protein
MMPDRYISMKFLLKSLAGIVFVFLFNTLSAQQTPRFSQYIMNEFVINPAVAGADGRTSINLSMRKEWIGFSKNSPETYSLSAQTRILKSPFRVFRKGSVNRLRERTKGRVGFGANLFNDKNGAIRRTGLETTYAYHITGNNGQLSFGLTASLVQLKFNSSDMVFKDNSTEVMQGVINQSAYIPDFGVGINYLNRSFHIGASVSHVFESPVVLGGSDYKSSEIGYKRDYFLIAALHKEFANNPDWQYEPSVFVKMYDLLNFKGGYSGPGTQVDFTYKLFYMNRYWMGAMVRTNADFGVMLGFKTLSDLYISYAFDYGSNELSRNSYGSHEIVLSKKFGDTARRYLWLDRY